MIDIKTDFSKPSKDCFLTIDKNGNKLKVGSLLGTLDSDVIIVNLYCTFSGLPFNRLYSCDSRSLTPSSLDSVPTTFSFKMKFNVLLSL